MKWNKFQRASFELSEKELLAAEKDILKLYNKAIRSINSRIEKQYAKLAGVAPADYYNEVLKYNRLNELLKQVQVDYIKYLSEAGKQLTLALENGMSESYYRSQFAMNWAAVDAKYTVLPNSLLEMCVLGTEESFKNVSAAVVKKFGEKADYMPQRGSLSKLLADNRLDDVKKIRNAITSGLIQGKPYKDMAKSIHDVVGRVTKDGKVTGAKAKAMRIIQTESTRVLNAGTFANDMQAIDQGIKITRTWQAVLDDRTRDRHAQLDDQEADKNGYFHQGGDRAKYPGEWSEAGMNINCRCSTISYTEGMKPDIRTGRNPVTGKTETFSYKNYKTWRAENGGN